MCFGTFVFSIGTVAFQQLQRQQAWRFGSSERVGARAALQFLGPGDDTVELSGLIAPEFTGERVSLDILRMLATNGQQLPLVDGTGRIYGDYVVTSLNETSTLFFPDGTPRRIEFQLSLRRAPESSKAGT